MLLIQVCSNYEQGVRKGLKFRCEDSLEINKKNAHLFENAIDHIY